MTSRYQAPFALGGESPIDAQLASRLLTRALEKGGDYADLFFEYGASASYAYDEGILKSAGRGVAMGLGVRVMKGDATGYAYVEDFTRHIPRAKVLSLRSVMTPGVPEGATAGDLLVSERIETVADRIESSALPYRVLTEAGEVVGHVGRQAVIDVLIGRGITR